MRPRRAHGPPVGPFTVNRDSPQSVGLVGWYVPAAMPGTKKLAELAVGRPTAVGSVVPSWSASAVQGSVLSFAGATNEYFTAAFTLGRASGTVGLWLRTTTAAQGMLTWSLTDRLVSYTDRMFWLDASGLPGWYVYCGSPQSKGIVKGSAAINDGAWHHMCGTYSAAGTVLYIDGMAVASQAYAVLVSGVTAMPFLNIGWAAANGTYYPPNPYYTGLWGPLTVHNRALSAAEVYQLWAPQTRWELYRPVMRRYYSIPVTGAVGVLGVVSAIGMGRPLIRPMGG